MTSLENCKTLEPTVFVVDDDEAVRSGIADLIEAMGRGVKTFGTAEEFLAAYDPAQPGCLVLDLQMPGMSGLELQTTFAIGGIRLPVIVITGHGDVNAAVRSMKLGAVDFLEKPFREQALSECVKKALERDAAIRQQESEHRAFQQRLSLLTDRERQIMELIITGKSDKQIAIELDITHRAVSFHRLHILGKMHVASIAELTMLAARVHFQK
jgi:two-component system response regulator FixJ